MNFALKRDIQLFEKRNKKYIWTKQDSLLILHILILTSSFLLFLTVQLVQFVLVYPPDHECATSNSPDHSSVTASSLQDVEQLTSARCLLGKELLVFTSVLAKAVVLCKWPIYRSVTTKVTCSARELNLCLLLHARGHERCCTFHYQSSHEQTQ